VKVTGAVTLLVFGHPKHKQKYDFGVSSKNVFGIFTDRAS